MLSGYQGERESCLISGARENCSNLMRVGWRSGPHGADARVGWVKSLRNALGQPKGLRDAG